LRKTGRQLRAPRLFDVHSLERHGLADQLRDAGSRRTATEEEKSLIRDPLLRDAQRSEDAGQCDPGRSLDVIVERANLVAIPVENGNRVDAGKIFPLDAAFRLERLHCADKFRDKGHVSLATHAVLPQAEVQRIIEQRLIVRADVENDRQAVLRGHAGASGIERQLAERYAHAPGSEIPQSQDALAVGDDDEAHVLLRPVAEDLAQPAASADGQIHAPGGPVDVGELLTGLADRRCIDQRHVGRRVRHQHRVEQCLVARLQLRQDEILLQVALEARDLGVSARDLPFDRGDGGG